MLHKEAVLSLDLSKRNHALSPAHVLQRDLL